MTRRTRNTLIGLALGSAALAVALPPAARAAAPNPTLFQAAPALSAYQLGADDVLSIKVVNFPDLTTQVTVAPDGTITVPLLAPLSVTGKTTVDIARLLARQWNDYVINPNVSVSLSQKRPQNVLVYGSVARAGTIEYRPLLHILPALAEDGGPSPTGDLALVTVTHPDGSSQVLDLSRPETKGGTEADILLQAGDVIYIPERRSQFSVVGEVDRPGSYAYRDDMTVLDALTEVGGVKETADLSNATLIHGGAEQPLNLDALLRRGDLSINTKLAAGDRILVPEIHNRTYVFGAVGRPGYYTFKPGDRVLDALNSSGPTTEADYGRINVIHVDKVKNTATVQTVDLYKFLRSGDMLPNVALQAGDVLYVPDKRHKFQIGDVFNSLTSLSVVANTTRLLTGK